MGGGGLGGGVGYKCHLREKEDMTLLEIQIMGIYLIMKVLPNINYR